MLLKVIKTNNNKKTQAGRKVLLPECFTEDQRLH